MTSRILCIVIALMVLSISAIFVANPGILSVVEVAAVAEEPEITGDVNRDGVVNILDLVEVASQFGLQGEPAAADVGEFQSDLNGLPVKVTISPQDNADVNTMRARDLQKNYGDHGGRFVRFTGVVDEAYEPIEFFKEPALLVLEGYPRIYVTPLDAPNLPEVYQTGHKYEFTGFLVDYIGHADFSSIGNATMHVYAFEIRHLGEAD